MSTALYRASVALAAIATAILVLSLSLMIIDRPGLIVWIGFATGPELLMSSVIAVGSAIWLKEGRADRWIWRARLALSVMFCVQIAAVTLVAARYDISRMCIALAACTVAIAVSAKLNTPQWLILQLPLAVTFALCFGGGIYAAAIGALEFAAMGCYVAATCITMGVGKGQV